VIEAMVEYFSGDVRRIHHFLKVYAFAKTIGELESLDARTQEILEIAAVTHDIGIKNSELKYGSADGHHQEIEGPPEAESLLYSLGTDGEIIARVTWLIAHHHSYTAEMPPDLQALVEADFLVNASEDAMSPEAIEAVGHRVFRTASGRRLLTGMYPPPSGRD
jgi:HD superfamily phosphodiesterase